MLPSWVWAAREHEKEQPLLRGTGRLRSSESEAGSTPSPEWYYIVLP